MDLYSHCLLYSYTENTSLSTGDSEGCFYADEFTACPYPYVASYHVKSLVVKTLAQSPKFFLPNHHTFLLPKFFTIWYTII